MRGSRGVCVGGGAEVRTPPPRKSQNMGFLSNTGPDPLKNHKATKPADVCLLLLLSCIGEHYFSAIKKNVNRIAPPMANCDLYNKTYNVQVVHLLLLRIILVV